MPEICGLADTKEQFYVLGFDCLAAVADDIHCSKVLLKIRCSLK